MDQLFAEHFETADAVSKVKVADVRRALGSQGNESNGRNFRPWLSRILGGIPIQTQSIGGKSWLMGYRARVVVAEPQPPTSQPEPPGIPPVVSIDVTNELLHAMQAISVERFGPDAPHLAEAARQVFVTLNELHQQAASFRETVVHLLRQARASEPQAFLRHLIGERRDVAIRPEYKPFYVLGPGGRRQFRSIV